MGCISILLVKYNRNALISKNSPKGEFLHGEVAYIRLLYIMHMFFILREKFQYMQYWLMKSEPSCYSIDDLARQKVGMWDDVRSYQARNYMRAMEKGDTVLFYHSNTEPIGIVGLASVERTAYPDPTQFDATSYKFDTKSTQENPRWSAVDVRFVEKFVSPLTLAELKNDPYFNTMAVVQRGMRLSVQSVEVKHFNRILALRSKHKKV
jgi:predicted RNA-binding protein with PUA-like domain